MRTQIKDVAIGVAVIAAIAGWLRLYISGCENSACRVIGVYTYRVADLSDYRDYLAGIDLYRLHGAASLAFNCQSIREQFAEQITQMMVEETALARTKDSRTEARAEGKALHITNTYAPKLDSWAADTTTELKSDPQDKKRFWQVLAMRRLFDSIVLHQNGQTATIKMTERYACDGVRKSLK